MPLKPGTRLGPYEILALLGAESQSRARKQAGRAERRPSGDPNRAILARAR